MKANYQNPLIVALDVNSPFKALELVRKLKVTGVAFKVGFELFMSGGPRLVEKILAHDVRVFLDLKYHDIPNTVFEASKLATKLGVWMFNVHASGGVDMMKKAKEASLATAAQKRIKPPLVIGVTVLTSFSDLKTLGIDKPVSDLVLHLAEQANEAGLDGVVSSAQESKLIRQKINSSFKIVTPGIRFKEDEKSDQKRVMTPKEAIKNGSDFLVMGRSLLSQKKPIQKIHQILSSL